MRNRLLSFSGSTMNRCRDWRVFSTYRFGRSCCLWRWAVCCPGRRGGVGGGGGFCAWGFLWSSWRIGWRSAFSAVCLLMVVLAVALWVRSYDWFDITERTSALNVCSMQGKLFVGDAFMLLGHDSANLTVPLPPDHFGICTLS